MASAIHEFPQPTERQPRLDGRGVMRVLDICADCTDAYVTEATLHDSHGLTIAHLVDFHELHRLLSPWFVESTSVEDIASFPVVAELFRSSAEPMLLSPGCITELEAFLGRMHDLARGVAGAMKSSDVARAKRTLLDYFTGYSDVIGSTQQEVDLLAACETVKEAQAIAVDSLSRVNSGLHRLRALLQDPATIRLKDLVRPDDLVLNSASVRVNAEVLGNLRGGSNAPGSLSRANLIDAHNICLADALNELSRRNAIRIPRGRPLYFFKLLTDTRAIYEAQRNLSLAIEYKDYLGHRVQLLEPADSALLKRRLRFLSLRGREDDIEELHSAANEARTSLKAVMWRLRGSMELGPVLMNLQPPRRTKFKDDQRARRALARLARFAWIARKTIGKELRLIAGAHRVIGVDDEPSSARPYSVPADCDRILDSILEVKRIVQAHTTIGSAFTDLHASLPLIDQPTAHASLADMGFNAPDFSPTDERITVVLSTLDRIEDRDSGASLSRVVITMSAYRNGVVTVAWPRIGPFEAELAALQHSIESMDEPEKITSVLAFGYDEQIRELSARSFVDIGSLIQSCWWVRVNLGRFDCFFELATQTEDHPQTGFLFNGSDLSCIEVAKDIALATGGRWVRERAFVEEYWLPAKSAIERWLGESRGGER